MSSNIFTHTPTAWEDCLTARTSLNKYISGSRLAHTISVEMQALDMAKIIFPVLGIDSSFLSDVSCAALLHDITKHKGLDEQLEMCRKYGIKTESEADKSCAILHSKTGAHLAKELFGVNDIVFNAIYSHTVGSCDMDIISKIIFLADYIEPTRTHASCKDVRDMFYCSMSDSHDNCINVLDKCIVKSIDLTVNYLIQQNSLIHPQTVVTRNSILETCVF